MIQMQRILCAVDFSDYSRRALDHAIAIARWYGSTVTVLHVFTPAPVGVPAPGVAAFEPVFLPVDRDQLLAETRAFAAAEGAVGVAAEAIVREGPAVREIVDQATEMAADLVVLGTHGRSGFERFLLGSVAEKVLRKAPCPVMTVPKRLPDAAPAGPVLFKRILCPVDFAASSLHAVRYAVSMAQENDAELTLLHVVAHEFEHPSSAASIAHEAGMTIGDYLKEREQDLQRRLQEIVAGASDVCRVESLIAYGKPWREILRVAADSRCELIVIGVHGRAAADLMFFGSTTQHVVREALCPVLTLRSA
jgi:nucleotide-binding universal stress UspA family protein